MLKKAVLAGASLLCLTHYAQAQATINQLIAFGDSTTDTGWFKNASTLGPNPPLSLGTLAGLVYDGLIRIAIANGGDARFTGPGLGNAQILGSLLGEAPGLLANPANTPGGTNYAIGGAFNGATPVAGQPNTGPGFENLFSTTFGVANPNLPGTARQTSNYLANVNGRANPNALYLVSSGGNTALFASMTFGANAAAANPFLLSEAQALADGVAQLQRAGARYIIVANEYTPPSVIGTSAVEYGRTLEEATWAALAAAHVNFIAADTATVIADVQQNPGAFGITEPTSNACNFPFSLPAPLSTFLPAVQSALQSGVLCTPKTTPTFPVGNLVSSDATKTHLFVDGTHLSEAGQIIIADYYKALLDGQGDMEALPETETETTIQTINGIQQQLDLQQLELRGRLRPAGFNVWMNGDLSSLELDNSAMGFSSERGWPVSGTLGFDYKWLSGWLAGAAVTAEHVNSTFSLGGGFTQDLGSLSAYTAYYNGNFWGNLIGTIGFLDDRTSRNEPIGITDQPNNGSTTGYDLSIAGEIGYDFHAGPIAHGPVGGFILQQAVINGFTESGSFTSLAFGRQIRNSEISLLGYRARYDWGMWHPFAQVLWDHEFDPLDGVVVTASLTTTAAPSYSLPEVMPGRDWATTTVGTDVTLTPHWSALASFTAQIGEQRAPIYGGLIGVNYAFGQATELPVFVKD